MARRAVTRVSAKHTLLLIAVFFVTAVATRGVFAQTPTATPNGEFLCSKGPRDGRACNTDDDCAPGGACVIGQGVCNGGTDDGLPCDCAGTSGTACVGSGTSGTCQGGTMDGGSCDPSNTNSTGICSGGVPCTASQKVCLGAAGGTRGFSCLRNDQCDTGFTCASTGKFCVDTTDFAGFSCVADDDCCTNPPCGAGSCVTPVPAETATPTRTRTVTPTRSAGTAVPTETRTPTRTGTPPTPTRTGTPASPTRTPTSTVGTPVGPTDTPTRTQTPGPGAHLAVAISAGAGAVTLDDSSAFPGTCGTFRIDSECLGYIGKIGNTLTNVQRGLAVANKLAPTCLHGSVPTAHAAGALATFLPPRGALICEVVSEGGGSCALVPSGQGSRSIVALVMAGLAGWWLRKRRG
jgi:hypothetical protein